MAAQDLTITATYDITYYRGSTFELVFTATNTDTGLSIDLTGYTIEVDIKEHKRSATALLSFTAADGVTISSNTFTLSKTAAQMTLVDGVHYWDCKVTKPDGTVEYWYEGKFTVERNVTE